MTPTLPPRQANPLLFAPSHPDAKTPGAVPGGLYGDALRGYIVRRAQQLGLDPNAVLAVAPHEGGFAGAVGDQGTSFGPFQLHIGGALPAAHTGDARAFANSPAGVDYALQQIKDAVGGKRGPAAVQAIVTGFEKPAAKYVPGEVAASTATYQQLAQAGGQQTGSWLDALAPPSAGARPAKPAAGSWLSALEPSAAPTARAAAAVRPAQGSWLDALAPAPGVGGKLPLPTPGNVTGFVPPVTGKIIGSPYQGTHAVAFNKAGGSDNWESERAYDISVPVGTPVRAPFNGTIGAQFGSLGEGGRFAGLRLHVISPTNEAYLAHLSRFAPGIRPGAKVQAGQVIGYTGEADGVAHLHAALRTGNPALLIG